MRHNKKRNSALLYEFLVRHISKCLIENKKDEANKAVGLSKKYFSKGTALHEELSLYRALLGTYVKSKHSAQRVIDAVGNASAKINARILDTEKSQLIKEINYTFNQKDEFYDHKIPNYVVYASVHTLLSESRNKKKILTEVDQIKLEDTIVEYLTKEKEARNDTLKQNPDFNHAVYKFVVNKFHEKYAGRLTENQKKVLMQYAVYLISEDQKTLKETILKEVSVIKERLSFVKDADVRKDVDLMKKMTECYKKFSEYDFSKVSEETILEVLQYMQLVEEVES